MTQSIVKFGNQLAALPDMELMEVVERAIAKRGLLDVNLLLTALHVAMKRDKVATTLSGRALLVFPSVEDAFDDLQIHVSARRVILTYPMFTASAVADAIGASGPGRLSVPSAYRRQGRLLGLSDGGRRLVYPAFQFDLVGRRIWPTVEEINLHLFAADDPWGVASWWTSPNPRLRGAAPMDLLGTERDSDLRELSGVA